MDECHQRINVNRRINVTKEMNADFAISIRKRVLSNDWLQSDECLSGNVGH